MSFDTLGLSEAILDGLRDMGFTAPTPIQQQSIPPVIEGKDLIASAETGTGKTGAFVIPLLERISRTPKKGFIRALILAPTRELAQQIDEQITAIGYYSGITSATVYGGGKSDDWGYQERALVTEPVDIIVATPGRLLDHCKAKVVDFSHLETLILDEADRMLDMGFIPDVRSIISKLPKQRQTLLFSATIPDEFVAFVQGITVDPHRIDVAKRRTAKGVTQHIYLVDEVHKVDLLQDVLKNESYQSIIVFLKTKKCTDQLYRTLKKKHIPVGAIHGDREQEERNQALDAFKSGQIKVLVATDVLARGIDIEEVSLIVNFDCPHDVEDYIHRIGRTGRAEATGTAITFITPREMKMLKAIERKTRQTFTPLSFPTANEAEPAPVASETVVQEQRAERQEKSGGIKKTVAKAEQMQRPVIVKEAYTAPKPVVESSAMNGASQDPGRKKHKNNKSRFDKKRRPNQDKEEHAAATQSAPREKHPPKKGFNKHHRAGIAGAIAQNAAFNGGVVQQAAVQAETPKGLLGKIKSWFSR